MSTKHCFMYCRYYIYMYMYSLPSWCLAAFPYWDTEWICIGFACVRTGPTRYRVVVQGFPKAISEKNLREHFEPCGEIQEIKMPKKKDWRTITHGLGFRESHHLFGFVFHGHPHSPVGAVFLHIKPPERLRLQNGWFNWVDSKNRDILKNMSEDHLRRSKKGIWIASSKRNLNSVETLRQEDGFHLSLSWEGSPPALWHRSPPFVPDVVPRGWRTERCGVHQLCFEGENKHRSNAATSSWDRGLFGKAVNHTGIWGLKSEGGNARASQLVTSMCLQGSSTTTRSCCCFRSCTLFPV